MMRKRTFYLGLVLVIGLLCGCSTPSGVRPLQRGINLSHWFSQTRLPDYPPLPATADDMRLIRSLGMDHVRLPVDPVRLWDFPGGEELDPDTLEAVDAAIALALEHGLSVVVDMHPRPDFKTRLKNDPAFFESFRVFWSKLAIHMAKYKPRHLALEMLNEPMVEDPKQWQSMADELYRTIRQAAPRHAIIIGGAEWSDVAALRKLVLPEDPNVVYAFHFYEPHLFTHQGAEWGLPEWGKLENLPYPLEPEEGAKILAGIADADVRMAVQEYIDQRWNAEKIDGLIQNAATWSREHGAVLWCGEFGAYKEFAPSAARTRYLSDVRTVLERYGIGWAMWDYQGGFNLVNKDDSTATNVVDVSVARALGLPAND